MKVVFLDSGGVLFNNILEETRFLGLIADRYDLDQLELANQVHRVAPLYESGQFHVHQILRGVVGPDLNLNWIDGLYLDCLRSHSANIAAVRELRRSHPDVRIFLTNNEAAHWDELKNEEFGHFQLVDDLLSSWRVGHVKPSPGYFAELRRVCPVPAEALLVDDRRSVLDVGARLGMRTLQVRGEGELTRTLPMALDEQGVEAS